MMIRQHYLQQQRLNNNHDRLLERYQRLLAPSVSQFPAFGTSSLPGRNYDAYLNQIHGKDRSNSPSLALLSRAGIGTSTETYRWMGEGASESLPKNVRTTMQHSRQQPLPLLHAEKFEPVKVYEHPIFGPTPAYIRPVVAEEHTAVPVEITDEDVEDRPSTPPVEPIVPKAEETDDEEKSLPRGYISYKKWKAKYENLIPVNPLLFNIYTRRSNGSIHSYGQSLYASPSRSHRQRQISGDSDDFIRTPSDVDSISSETPAEPSLPTTRQYHRLRSSAYPSTMPSRLTEFVPEEEPNELPKNDVESPPDSPVPYLSRSGPSALPSPILPIMNAPASGTIPPAPPMPASLISSTSTPLYQTPASVSTTSTIQPPPSNSTGVYQAPSSLSIYNANAPKAVTFGDSSSIAAPVADVSSSSSDSDDDEEKKKRRRKKKRQAAGIADGDSSSSDD